MVLILIQSPGFASHNGALGGGSDTYRSSVCVGFISVHNLLGAQEMVAHVLTIKRWGKHPVERASVKLWGYSENHSHTVQRSSFLGLAVS